MTSKTPSNSPFKCTPLRPRTCGDPAAGGGLKKGHKSAIRRTSFTLQEAPPPQRKNGRPPPTHPKEGLNKMYDLMCLMQCEIRYVRRCETIRSATQPAGLRLRHDIQCFAPVLRFMSPQRVVPHRESCKEASPQSIVSTKRHLLRVVHSKSHPQNADAKD